MGNNPSLIEINGQLYDANTGRLFHHPRSQVIDGFMRKPRSDQAVKKSKRSSASGGHRAPSAEAHPREAAQSIHLQAQKTKTLTRKGLKNPTGSHRHRGKASSSNVHTEKPNTARISRAMSVMKNSRVNRFGKPNSNKPHVSQVGKHGKIATRDNSNLVNNSGSMALTVKPSASMVASVSHHRLEQMLDEALIKADAHKKALSQRISGKSRFHRYLGFMPKWSAAAVVALVVLMAGSYFAWRNVPSVSMKVASSRAHIDGALPAYVPSGFKFSGPVEYETGGLSVTFKTADQRTFTLQQQASSLDSSALKSDAVADDAKVQTSQVKGATVYLDSSKNEATWISDGKRFVIRGQLTPDEIFKIAGSIL